MKITRRWLQKFVDISSTSNQDITIALNSLGFEVDSFKDYSELNSSLKIGHVGGATPVEGTHLKFTFVDKGDDLVSPIVCGAPNAREGLYVIVAEPGTTIANGLTLSAKEIQGKLSEGMMCALNEIGIDNSVLTELEQDSIYEIYTKTDTYTLIGHENALERIGFNDSVWEVDLTLNRSDALSAMQIAKELSNYFNIEFNNFSTQLEPKISGEANVSFDAKMDDAVEQIAIDLVGVKEINRIDDNFKHHIFSKQDLWLKHSGVKSTGNFYEDLANAIALESGQPVLFLDAQKIKGELSVKNNPTDKNETSLELLDDSNVVSVLGVNVDSDYLPTEDTKEILVVYLSLKPSFMRKQQKSYNTSTPSMQRYMKPISREIFDVARTRVIHWFDQYEILSTISETKYIKQLEPKDKVINTSLEYINSLLGLELSFNEVKGLFKTLDFIIDGDEENMKFTFDKCRTDISMPADIAEEVARLYGYNNIKPVALTIKCDKKSKHLEHKIQKQIQGFLLGNGFNNAKTYSLRNSEDVQNWNLFNISNPINLMSPLSKMRETYRLSIFNSLIETAQLNSSRGNKTIKLFEFADIYNMDYLREKHLGFIVSGAILKEKAWDIDVENSYAYVKGYVESILSHYKIDSNNVSLKHFDAKNSSVHPYVSAQITINGELIGFILKLSPKAHQSNKLDTTFVVEMNISKIEEMYDDKIFMNEIPKFQKTSRDVSVILTEDMPFENLMEATLKDVKFIEGYQLSDIYSDDELKANNSKSVSISFTFNSNEKQLTDSDVSAEWNKLLENITKFGAVIR